ncbi:hypothetical protein Tsubulata_048774 [Turnera subulata]|uniref:CCHC-type domain-containing protein n=1 Tax=Turnera subulata TaxID=218843 RepID=A0A9Q0FKM5_9ROSI|nr:hypothetical protein Tsubulata_048774 [Turnera subulata]
MRVGNRIGKFLRVDNATLTASRCNFARICVEVDLTKPLKSKFKIRRKVHRLVYEGPHNICFECGKFGHMRDRCSDAIRDDLVEEIEDRVNDLPQEEVISPEVLDPYGPWMIAQKNRRKRSPKEGTGDNHKQQMPKSQPPTPKKVADDMSKNANYQKVSSSRFGVLADLEDEGDLHGLEEVEAQSVPFNVNSQAVTLPQIQTNKVQRKTGAMASKVQSMQQPKEGISAVSQAQASGAKLKQKSFSQPTYTSNKALVSGQKMAANQSSSLQPRVAASTSVIKSQVLASTSVIKPNGPVIQNAPLTMEVETGNLDTFMEPPDPGDSQQDHMEIIEEVTTQVTTGGHDAKIGTDSLVQIGHEASAHGGNSTNLSV